MFSPFQSLQFESCQISLACCRLLKLIHEVLKQATGGGSGAELAVMLYRTSRDCLDIFEGVVQVGGGLSFSYVLRFFLFYYYGYMTSRIIQTLEIFDVLFIVVDFYELTCYMTE